jgi:hypothetical protein
MAELLYRTAVSSLGWHRRWVPVIGLKSFPRMFTIGLLLAREFGDSTTERRLMRKLESFDNGRYFNGGDGEHEDEFGFFFKFGEAYPRGQESALLMLSDIMDGEGGWYDAFNDSDAEKFDAPTVVEVDYPKLGLSRAENDEARGTLELETYVATSSEAGAPTRFRVTQLPDASSVAVLRDGSPYEGWTRLGPDSIEIETEVAKACFSISTGYRSVTRDREAAGTASSDAGAATRAASLRPVDLARVTVAVRSASLGCPCCA